MACEKCGGIGYVRLTVPVGHPAFGRAIPCECQRDRLAKRRAERLREQAGIADAELRFWQFDTFRPDQCQPPAVRPAMEAAKQRCIEFAEQPAEHPGEAPALDGNVDQSLPLGIFARAVLRVFHAFPLPADVVE